ncbi:FAD-dependent monooxygenase protein [Rutstroemia sp. NJR-2017a BBW]|nr:FAD-dependent monooxygenase protein [Rutstroemia sp. NJR-2017a BBW]
MHSLTTFAFTAALFGTQAIASSNATNPYQTLPKCKTTPSDATWPSDQDWTSLNSSINGALIRTRPVASSCYPGNPFGSPMTCDEVKAGWGLSSFHAEIPETVNYFLWANDTCLPPNADNYDASASCQIGGYPQYVVNVTTAEQVATALKWATSKNIRVVVKGTGHDLSGRSSGAYSLSIWTHHLKSITFDAAWPVPGTNETVPAITAGSGNIWGDVLSHALGYDRAVCTGADKTVGLGGYIQGGGHGPLSSTYGLASDQLLQVTVVTPAGEILVANDVQNTDLFWAIRGGGGGQFGVVTEFVMLTYPAPVNITAASITIAARNLNSNDSAVADATWLAYAKFMSLVPDLMDSGVVGSGGAYIGSTAMALAGLSSPPPGIYSGLSIWSYNLSSAELNSTLYSARRAVMETLGTDSSLVVFNISAVTTTANYSSFFQSMNGGQSLAGEGGLGPSRLIGRAELGDRDVHEVSSLFQQVLVGNTTKASSGYFTIGMQAGLGPRNVPLKRRGALNPVWRETYLHVLVSSGGTNTGATPYQKMKADAAWAEKNTEAVWREWAPETGAYMNEANPMNSQFKHDYYGDSYDRLVQIKRKYDPTYAMFVWAGVDSDFWEYDMDTDGLLDEHLLSL